MPTLNRSLIRLRGDLTEAEAAKHVGRSVAWWSERESGVKPLVDRDRALLAKRFRVEWTAGGRWLWMND